MAGAALRPTFNDVLSGCVRRDATALLVYDQQLLIGLQARVGYKKVAIASAAQKRRPSVDHRTPLTLFLLLDTGKALWIADFIAS